MRFRGFAPPEIVKASRGYTDAQSINYYVNDGRLDEEMFRMMNEESDQPVILSEYSFHALDGRSGPGIVAVAIGLTIPDRLFVELEAI